MGQANAADLLTRAYDNYCRILLLVTEQIAFPSQANVDKLTAATEGAGVVGPQVTYSKDGISYDWTGYQQAIVSTILPGLRSAIIAAAGPFNVASRARVSNG